MDPDPYLNPNCHDEYLNQETQPQPAPQPTYLYPESQAPASFQHIKQPHEMPYGGTTPVNMTHRPHPTTQNAQPSGAAHHGSTTGTVDPNVSAGWCSQTPPRSEHILIAVGSWDSGANPTGSYPPSESFRGRLEAPKLALGKLPGKSARTQSTERQHSSS